MNSVGGATNAIYAEQVDTVFRQMPIALAVNVVNAGLTTVALAPFASQPLPLPWFAAVLLVTAGRMALWLRYRRALAVSKASAISRSLRPQVHCWPVCPGELAARSCSRWSRSPVRFSSPW